MPRRFTMRAGAAGTMMPVAVAAGEVHRLECLVRILERGRDCQADRTAAGPGPGPGEQRPTWADRGRRLTSKCRLVAVVRAQVRLARTEMTGRRGAIRYDASLAT